MDGANSRSSLQDEGMVADSCHSSNGRSEMIYDDTTINLEGDFLERDLSMMLKYLLEDVCMVCCSLGIPRHLFCTRSVPAGRHPSSLATSIPGLSAFWLNCVKL